MRGLEILVPPLTSVEGRGLEIEFYHDLISRASAMKLYKNSEQ